MKKIQEINDICKEVISILAFCDEDIIAKIPSMTLRKISELAADSKENYYFDKEKDLISQNISEKSKDFIALLYYSYIADTNEKNELSRMWNENEKKYLKDLHEKYNFDNIFKNINEDEPIIIKKDNKALINYEETFWMKLKNFVLIMITKKG